MGLDRLQGPTRDPRSPRSCARSPCRWAGRRRDPQSSGSTVSRNPPQRSAIGRPSERGRLQRGEPEVLVRGGDEGPAVGVQPAEAGVGQAAEQLDVGRPRPAPAPCGPDPRPPRRGARRGGARRRPPRRRRSCRAAAARRRGGTPARGQAWPPGGRRGPCRGEAGAPRPRCRRSAGAGWRSRWSCRGARRRWPSRPGPSGAGTAPPGPTARAASPVAPE